jgi:hypothetical protein
MNADVNAYASVYRFGVSAKRGLDVGTHHRSDTGFQGGTAVGTEAAAPTSYLWVYQHTYIQFRGNSDCCFGSHMR